MSFANMNHIPRIPSYQEAAFRFNNIKPIRGSENIRPLGNRRSKHYAIQKHDDTYVCMLYGHSVLAFSKDEDGNTIFKINLCGYDTQTTRRFISRILDTGCYSYGGNTYVDVGKFCFYLPNHHTMQIKQGKVLNPVAVTKKVLDQEITKQLREKYKESMADAEAMLSLGLARFSGGVGMSDGGYDPRKKMSEYGREFLDDLTREEMTEYLWLTASDIGLRRVQVRKITYNINTQKHEVEDKLRPPTRYYIVAALYHVAQWGGLDIHKEVEVPIGRRA